MTDTPGSFGDSGVPHPVVYGPERDGLGRTIRREIPYPVIRLAQLGIDGEVLAESWDEVGLMTNLEWVEIDGHRIETGVIKASIDLGDHVNTVTITLCGRIELVTMTEENGGASSSSI